MQNQAKEKIKKFIDRYEEVKTSGKIKSHAEEETKKNFIFSLEIKHKPDYQEIIIDNFNKIIC